MVPLNGNLVHYPAILQSDSASTKAYMKILLNILIVIFLDWGTFPEECNGFERTWKNEFCEFLGSITKERSVLDGVLKKIF